MEFNLAGRQEPSTDIDTRQAERLALGMGIVERVRLRANGETRYFSGEDGRDFFHQLYLEPRTTAVPEDLAGEWDERTSDVRALYAQVFDAVREELDERMGRDESHWLDIDVAIDDHTTAILSTDQSVLMRYSEKPWRFTWESEAAMAESLRDIYETAATRLLAERQRTPTYGTATT
jgi:hypothetical protein